MVHAVKDARQATAGPGPRSAEHPTRFWPVVLQWMPGFKGPDGALRGVKSTETAPAPGSSSRPRVRIEP
ncbi:hypothetical protein HMPREF0682_1661 [Propionibacterium acidifaciens F0233]|uniref:Uncharacterized protein n=1 Tax=Propionibacterium acidifaciens F0233 TaxID=553198 RepID=U2RRA9_9ACTN|nr:hypothetical protein HMPREF0682_1661 [Propionibacterium acidifaciens F0233]